MDAPAPCPWCPRAAAGLTGPCPAATTRNHRFCNAMRRRAAGEPGLDEWTWLPLGLPQPRAAASPPRPVPAAAPAPPPAPTELELLRTLPPCPHVRLCGCSTPGLECGPGGVRPGARVTREECLACLDGS